MCNYRLMPERVGGMDRFYWEFDKKGKALGHEIVWFFPNMASHGGYPDLTVYGAGNQSVEEFFLTYCREEHKTFDVVMTHFLELCTPFYKQIKALFPCKIVAVDHNPRPINGYPLKKKIGKLIKGVLYARYIDLFVGVSEYTKHHILKDFGSRLASKTQVVYNGIVHELYEKRKQRNLKKPSFLVACHLRYSKGIQDLIEAVSLLPNDIKQELHIDIYGEGEYRSQLLANIAKHHLDNVFAFKGSVPNLYEIYAQYDYLLQPTHMECFSLSILESLGANVPVVTTSVGGNEEAVKHGKNGYIFEPENVKALSGLLEKLFTGDIAITEATNQHIEANFSIEKMVAEHLKLI